MSSIPFPNIVQDAAQISQSPLTEYARSVQLQGERQQITAQQQDNQMRQRQMADQDALTKTLAEYDPSKHTPADIPQLITKNGGSGDMALKAQAGYLKQHQDYLELSDKQFTQEQKKADLLTGFHDQVTTAPPEQKQQIYQQGLPSLANAGVDVSKEPTQYPGDEAFAKHLPAIRLHSAMMAEADKDREISAKEKTAAADQQKANAADWKDFPQLGISLNTQTGEQRSVGNGAMMPPGMMEAKYVALQQKKIAGQPLNPADATWVKAYEKAKLLVPNSTMTLRMDGLAQMREYPVINKQSGELEMQNSKVINASPGTYAPAGEGAKSMSKTALIEDIRGNVQQVRQSLQAMPEFDSTMKAKIAMALKSRDPRSAISSLIGGEAKNLSDPAQQDYLINTSLLIENAMAMRSVLGAGQGSEDLRSAIMATIPGPATPNKAYAGKQLDQFEKVLSRLERGIPGMPLKGAGDTQQGGGSNAKSPKTESDPLGIR